VSGTERPSGARRGGRRGDSPTAPLRTAMRAAPLLGVGGGVRVAWIPRLTLRAPPPKLRSMFRGELKAGEHRLSFGDVTYVMGVINLSPESKNAHTVAATPEEALSLADRYRAWGADLVEVGGQSSHYDNPTIEVDEEIKRVVPAVESLVADGHVVAVDTWKPAVA